MQIIRGTTPTIIINIKDDIDFSQITSTWIFISQRGKVRVDKTIRDITVNPLERRIKLPLSQEDTLNLKEGDATIQVRILMSDGTALSSFEKEIEVLSTGKEGEIEPEQFTPEQWTVGPEPTIEKIKLNLIPIGNMPVCHASQFDKKRQIEIEIYNGAQPYFLSDEELELVIKKPDGNLVSMDIPYEVGSNSVIFETTEQTCAVAGKCLCELRVTKGEQDLGSLNFYLCVEEAPDEGGITSQSEINNLARQVHDIVVEELEDNGAEETGYDNTESGLEATNVQDAIDEVNTKIENIPSVDAYTKEETDDKFATKTALNDKANKDDFDNLVEGLSDYGILQVGSIRNIYDKTHNTAGSYWIVASDTNKAKHYAYTGWNYTEDYEILNGASYVYKGLTVLGSSPVATYLDSNHSPIAGAYFHAQTGENTINPPPDAKYISFSVNNADVNTFELIQTTGGSQINERVTVLERSITRCNLYETPTPEDHDLCIVNNGLGVAYSDLQQWLWVGTNGAAVCCNAYSTLKFSDGKIINQINGDAVYEIYSVTKLLSCLVAAMYIPALSDTVTVIASDIGSETGSTIVQEGDVISYEDLLYAALLKSDNNAANALRRPIGFIIDTSAQTTAQAKAAFYNKMQEVANSIGMTNTDCNPVRISAAAGVHSTTNDLCKLVKYIYENNSIISGIWGQLSHQITVAGTNPRSWTVNSTTTPQARQIIPEFVGGKTGSGNIPYTYAFCWKDSDNNYYATALLDGDLRKGNRFDDSRLILNNAYFAMNS